MDLVAYASSAFGSLDALQIRRGVVAWTSLHTYLILSRCLSRSSCRGSVNGVKHHSYLIWHCRQQHRRKCSCCFWPVSTVSDNYLRNSTMKQRIWMAPVSIKWRQSFQANAFYQIAAHFHSKALKSYNPTGGIDPLLKGCALFRMQWPMSSTVWYNSALKYSLLNE